MLALMGNSKKLVKSWLIDRMFSYSGGRYQRERFPQEKFDQLLANIDMSSVGSVLDVGCNEGFITSEFAKRGKFCVGIDVGPYFLNPLLNELDQIYGKQSAAFGVFPLNNDSIAAMPEFDLILLLSVHHQWTKRHGDDYTRRLVGALMDKAKRYFIIEFAATAQKYGFSEPQFTDNDDDSIRRYAERWLRALQPTQNLNLRFIGKNREHSPGVDREPSRFIFLIEK